MAGPKPKTQEEKEPVGGKVTVKAVVTRKDGTIEDLGIISEGLIGFDAATDPS